ncbi:MAG TPA: tetratricopeptide repeat protein, partial [Chthoniobacteraceae bacterium]
MINPAAQLERLLQKALQSHRAGRLAEAESGYRAVLSHDSEHSEALHLLGILAAQSGRPDLAVALLQRAVAADPASAAAHSNLGSALQSASRLEEALSACRHAIALDASSAEAHYNLGVVLQRLERFDEAALAFQESARLNPNAAGAFNNLGIVLEARGRIEEAVTAGKRAVALDPTSADNQINLGNSFQSGGLLDEAIVAYREAIRLQPSNASAQSNLSSALFNAGQIDEAADAAREALRLEPNRAEASNNHGNCYRAQALPAQALDCFRQALAHTPNSAEAQSNYLFTLNFDPQLDAQQILTEHRAWGSRMARLAPDRTTPHANDRSPERRLCIGLVSPDLRNHVVGHSLRALFQVRDRQALEMVCYANIRNSDAVTDQLRVLADGWRNIAGQSDADVARQIEADRIDILFDLAVHSGGNRLALFARKPAPIQVSYLGYPGTTGLDAIDYRLSDAYIDPVGEDSD